MFYYKDYRDTPPPQKKKKKKKKTWYLYLFRPLYSANPDREGSLRGVHTLVVLGVLMALAW